MRRIFEHPDKSLICLFFKKKISSCELPSNTVRLHSIISGLALAQSEGGGCFEASQATN
jgi:hypothetical protein